MNPVETPMTQMMMAFGATSPQSIASMFGIHSVANDIQSDYAARFAGYIDMPSEAVSDIQATDFADLQQRLAQIYTAAPDNADFRINPAFSFNYDGSASELGDGAVDIETLVENLELIRSGNVLSLQDLAGTAENLAKLSLSYHGASPVSLDIESLAALQSLAPEQFATLTAQTVDPDSLPQLIQAQQLGAVQSQSAQFLPAAELRYFMGETAAQPESITLTTAQPLMTDAAAAQLAKHQAATAATAGNSVADTAATPAAGAVAQNPTLATAQTAAQQTQDATAAQTADTDAETDAEAQILAVQQKKTNPTAKAAAQTATSSATDTTVQAQSAQGQAAAAATKNTSGQTTDNSKAAKTARTDAATPTPETAPAQRPATPDMQIAASRSTNEWTSPWASAWTPERAAGWSETFSASLISGGLGGLMSENGALASMSLMGGRPNPAASAQIAKQVNVNVTRAVKAGDQQFTMRMDPAELGRVTVKLKFGPDGVVKSQVIAERPETLELLQRETRGLERAIEAGGAKADAGGINFSLDSGGEESAGRAFAEAMQEDRLKEEIANQQDGAAGDSDDMNEAMEQEIDLDEILAHVTPDTGIDVRV